ncbi:MAG: hypothetical protein ABIL09_16070 [Gemmatimonadota bacterium]
MIAIDSLLRAYGTGKPLSNPAALGIQKWLESNPEKRDERWDWLMHLYIGRTLPDAMDPDVKDVAMAQASAQAEGARGGLGAVTIIGFEGMERFGRAVMAGPGPPAIEGRVAEVLPAGQGDAEEADPRPPGEDPGVWEGEG